MWQQFSVHHTVNLNSDYDLSIVMQKGLLNYIPIDFYWNCVCVYFVWSSKKIIYSWSIERAKRSWKMSTDQIYIIWMNEGENLSKYESKRIELIRSKPIFGSQTNNLIWLWQQCLCNTFSSTESLKSSWEKKTNNNLICFYHQWWALRARIIL